MICKLIGGKFMVFQYSLLHKIISIKAIFILFALSALSQEKQNNADENNMVSSEISVGQRPNKIDIIDNFFQATADGDLYRVKNIIEAGTDVNLRNEDNYSVLMHAAASGYLDIVTYLVDHGANVEATDKYEKNALIYAVSYGHKDIVDYLIRKGVNVNAMDKWGNSAIKYAAFDGHKEVVELLKKHGAKD